jgi:hypothetical protein
MQEPRHILITVETNGKVEVQPMNFVGEGCVKAAQPLTSALVGQRPEEFKFKPEYYQAKTRTTAQALRNKN